MIPSNVTVSVSGGDMSVEQLVDTFIDDDLLIYTSTGAKAIKTSSVVNTRGSDSKDFVYIEANEYNVILTPQARVYDVETREWIRAEKITTACKLRVIDNAEPQQVTTIHTIKNSLSEKVYMLTIDETGSFFANKILIS